MKIAAILYRKLANSIHSFLLAMQHIAPGVVMRGRRCSMIVDVPGELVLKATRLSCSDGEAGCLVAEMIYLIAKNGKRRDPQPPVRSPRKMGAAGGRR